MGATSWGKSAQGIDFEPNPSTPHQAGTSPLECWYSGVVNQTAYASGNAVWTLSRLYSYAFTVGRSGYIDRIAFETTAGVATSLARVGIYRSSGRLNLYPSSLVVDGGEKDCSGTGILSSSVSVFLEAGIYWFVMLSGTAAPTLRRLSSGGGNSPSVGVPVTMGASPNAGLITVQTYGALPDSYPAGGSILSLGTQFPPAIHIRWSS